MGNSAQIGYGWHRDLPDFRDYSPRSPLPEESLRKLRLARGARGGLPPSVDLREFFGEVFDQDDLCGSAAQACVGLIRYFELRAHGRNAAPSRLFVHQQALRLAEAGNAAVDLRTTLKAIVRFGIPPERLWADQAVNPAATPDPTLFAYRDAYQGLQYVRLDACNQSGEQTLQTVKAFLGAGFPAAFGFPVPSSIGGDADIPYRPTFDDVEGGQAVVAVGYDDRRPGATRGALLVRNSWGSDWGEEGYGWLPYGYVQDQLAVDFWTLLKPDWLASGEFRRPRLDASSKRSSPASDRS